MIHNKYFHILEHFTGDYRKEVYGRELIGKVPLSQKAIALALQELENEHILKSRKTGTVRHYSINELHTGIKDVLLATEIQKKIDFLSTYRALAHLFREDERIVGIFGSYAKGTAKEHSDIDVFIIGRTMEEDYGKKGKSLNKEISIKYFSEREWAMLLRQKNNLCKEILANHILLFNSETFIRLAWREYYGFG